LCDGQKSLDAVPLEVRLRAAARDDLVDIRRYSELRWGDDRASLYLAEFQMKFALLSENPEIGSAHQGREQAYRKVGVGRHRIYYRRVGNVIRIIRILHVKMDAPRHLG
jgi:toxin ParE1/3/4